MSSIVGIATSAIFRQTLTGEDWPKSRIIGHLPRYVVQKRLAESRRRRLQLDDHLSESDDLVCFEERNNTQCERRAWERALIVLIDRGNDLGQGGGERHQLEGEQRKRKRRYDWLTLWIGQGKMSQSIDGRKCIHFYWRLDDLRNIIFPVFIFGRSFHAKRKTYYYYSIIQ